MKLCVYGGQYGSEGKGSAAEWLLKFTKRDGKQLVAIGENSPNSGHTCTLGKTRNLPAASYFADTVILGPDSAIDYDVVLEDLAAIKLATGKVPRLYIHENAAVVDDADREAEKSDGIVDRVSSTGSGSGSARAFFKGYMRYPDAVIGNHAHGKLTDAGYQVIILNRFQYIETIRSLIDEDCIFECSQGTLLDINWGVYPYCTSRSTLPQVAIQRNALDTLRWAYFGVYRTYPIRTGGPSGPTGGAELSWEAIGKTPEIATVTKRTRRVFKFSRDDFYLSLQLTKPACVMFTHLDYIGVDPHDLNGFSKWYGAATDGGPIDYRVEGLFLSDSTGNFVNHGVQNL
jgi:adenylosuccinate synthase